MDILSYLLERLEIWKTVGITALGTFYKKRIPGRYDTETQRFLPPKYEIAFSNTVENDDDFAHYIGEKRHISTESAHFFIQEFVKDIQSQLAKQQMAAIDGLGQLKIENNQLIFLPASAESAGFDFYGLPPVDALQSTKTTSESTPIANQEFADDVIMVHNTNNETAVVNAVEDTSDDNAIGSDVTMDKHAAVSIPNEAASGEALPDEPKAPETVLPLSPTEEPVAASETPPSGVDASAAPSVQETEATWKPTVNQRYEYGFDEEDKTNGRTKRMLRYTLIGIVILLVASGIAYLFFPGFFDGIIHGLKANTEQVYADTSLVEESPTQAADSNARDTIQTTVIPLENTSDSLHNVAIDSNITRYEIIGSAMKTHQMADKIIANLASVGIQAKKMDAMPGRLIKISLGTYTDYQLAKKMQDSLKIKLKNPEIYIQTIKPQH